MFFKDQWRQRNYPGETFCFISKQTLSYIAIYCNFNSLVPERCGSNFTNIFFKLIWWTDILNTSCEIGLGWVPQNHIDKWWEVNIGSGNGLVLSGLVVVANFTHILQGYFTSTGAIIWLPQCHDCPSASEVTQKNMGEWFPWIYQETIS